MDVKEEESEGTSSTVYVPEVYAGVALLLAVCAIKTTLAYVAS